jgi:hypothetical protein
MRERCGGAREDYVKIFGDEEFQPVGDAAQRRLPVLRDVVGH